jgi:hypothetical protein
MIYMHGKGIFDLQNLVWFKFLQTEKAMSTKKFRG